MKTWEDAHSPIIQPDSWVQTGSAITWNDCKLRYLPTVHEKQLWVLIKNESGTDIR